MDYFALVLLIHSLISSVIARPLHAQIVGQNADLNSEYDFVIIGGGLSGLTVADRLTENPTTSVLVIEYGPLDKQEPSVLVPGLLDLTTTPYLFNLTSTPQRGLNNRTFDIPAAAVVGGGTVVNGIFFDRGAAADYNAWGELGATGWEWADLLPYFRKSENFTPAAKSYAEDFNISWNESFHGHGGPIESSYPVFQFPSIKKFFQAWHSLNITTPKDPGGGHKEGVFWAPSSLDPRDQTRSYARRSHYDRTQPSRPNYHLLPDNAVSKIIFKGKTAIGAEYISTKTKTTAMVYARKEVVLAAGSMHTPQILQLSGVGPSTLLKALKIDIIADLPGVGQNFQDNPTIYANFTFQSRDTPHVEMLLSDQSYRAQQLALYYSKRQGPFTIAKDGGNVVAFLSLPTVTPSYRAIVEMAKSQSPASVYPSSTDPTVLAGYRKQRLIIIRLLNSTTAPVQETGWNTNSVIPITLLKPLSRGSIAVQSRDIFTQPLIDFRALSDPTDLEMLVAIVEINRKMIATAPMQGLGPVETVPGANLTSKEQLRTAVRQHLNPTYVHPCCTAAMMKKELGGVIDKNLLVYGLEGLSVVDASVFPMIPGTHPSATIYALAEKAADVIKGRHNIA